MRTLLRLFAVTMLATLSLPALADVPTNMNVQGLLKDDDGVPLPAGFKLFTFKIFDAPAGGTEIWPAGPGETQAVSTDSEGLWSAAVGSVISLTEPIFQDTARWLEITVNDGVNPPETLSRVKLNTLPYTYRAATAQHADSVGGLSFDQLDDRWVNRAGDSLSGQLKVIWPNSASTQPVLHVVDVSDGLTPVGFGPATWAAVSDAQSATSEPKYGFYGLAGGPLGLKGGIAGYATGAGATNVGVLGIVDPTASQNYSGWFQGGDLLVSSPASTGTLSVRLPDSAIDHLEILDEPGITQGMGAGVTLAASATSINFASTTISTPDDGYIVLNGQAYMQHLGDSSCFGWVQISETSTALRAPGSMWTGGGDQSAHATAVIYLTVPVRRVYFKPKGTYTFYLQGNKWESNAPGSGVQVLNPTSILATYYPASYGSVTTTSELPGEASAQVVAPESDPLVASTPAASVIDLRLLELDVLRKEAEAAQARNALLEAQLQAGGIVPTTSGVVD